MKYKSYVADFETTTDPNNCYVWAYAVREVSKFDDESKETIIGTSIDDFMKWCENAGNDKVFFHNLKFDGQFILYWLFKNGYKHVTEKKDKKTKTFTTLISDKGMWYSLEIIFKKGNKKINKITIQDSLKLIPLSVSAIAKSFKLPISKLKLDYGCHNGKPAGTPLTEHEIDYITNDVKIVAHAIDYFYSQGLNKMTIGSCALEEYKKLIDKRKFEKYFPPPKFHNDVKQSYRGGFTYLNPKFAGKVVKNGVVLDVNSLYPSVMYNEYLPYGTPIFFKGKYEEDEIYPLYTQMFRCSFKLKPGKIPTIQIKYGGIFRANEYLESSNDEEVVLCLNSVDLKLFFDHYEVYNIEYMSGWKFKATKGLFKDYIDKWSANKIKAKLEGNHGLYLISKLFLNSLYGKFGTDNKTRSKIPYLGADGLIHYTISEVEEKDPLYVALASFITSYARYKTITSAQKIQDDYNAGRSNIQFIYADTDSLHCLSPDFSLPDLEIDSTKLGAWDYEAKFRKAKYLRQKCYIESLIIDEDEFNKYKGTEEEFLYSYSKKNDEYNKLKITIAGMPASCYEEVSFNNFKLGATYKGKMLPEIVPGGVVLNEVDFTIVNI